MNNITVIKISGHGLTDEAYLSDFVAAVREWGEPTIVIHGGGVEITALQEQLGIEPVYVDGLRVTDADSMALVTMVLRGLVNTRLVRCFNAGGLDAIGISGVDRGIVEARQMQHESVDMGFTGEIVRVKPQPLLELLELGTIPVMAPVCGDANTEYNVNADPVTGKVALAVNAARVIFLSNVEGVLVNDQLLQTLTPSQVAELIADGIIYGGMIPKVTAALDLLQAGIPQVVITNLTGLLTHGGTTFINQ